MTKQEETAVVKQLEKLQEDIYDITLLAPETAKKAKAGQFVNVYPKDGAHLLPRPISICRYDAEKGTIRLVFRKVGFGTTELSNLATGDKIRVVGPLGNGYPAFKAEEKVLLFGGGIGIPPMLALAERLYKEGFSKEQILILSGYRDEPFLQDELSSFGTLIMASETGRVGVKGNVLDAVKKEGLSGTVACACGPLPMLRAIKAYAKEAGIPAYLSLEEKMACGVGACLGCVVKTTEVDDHSKVHNSRICADGPVFPAELVEI